jgi:hypothetical protein
MLVCKHLRNTNIPSSNAREICPTMKAWILELPDVLSSLVDLNVSFSFRGILKFPEIARQVQDALLAPFLQPYADAK